MDSKMLEIQLEGDSPESECPKSPANSAHWADAATITDHCDICAPQSPSHPHVGHMHPEVHCLSRGTCLNLKWVAVGTKTFCGYKINNRGSNSNSGKHSIQSKQVSWGTVINSHAIKEGKFLEESRRIVVLSSTK